MIQVPMILYTAEQILVGQVLVFMFKRWIGKDKEKDAEVVTVLEPVTEDDKH